MGTVLMVLGYGWMLVGLVTCAGATSAPAGQSDAALGVTAILTMLVFVLPGGVVGALGQHLNRKRHD